ncbi:MAG: hypothetical protein IKC77_03595 [Lentisphaeria bacterium]|nr:hypothetical protein [Lentisphaeria bacterium]
MREDFLNITKDEAEESYAKDMFVATCSDRMFYAWLSRQDIDNSCGIPELNAGIIAKFAVSAERLSELFNWGLDLENQAAAHMALRNVHADAARFVLNRYDLFSGIFAPRELDLNKLVFRVEKPEVLFELLLEFAPEMAKRIPFMLDSSRSAADNVGAAVFLLSCGSLWQSQINVEAHEKRVLKFFIKNIGNGIHKHGGIARALFPVFAGNCTEKADIICAIKVMMTLDILVSNDFEDVPVNALQYNIPALMDMSCEEFCNFTGYPDGISKDESTEFFNNSAVRDKLLDFIIGDELENELFDEMEKTVPDLEKIETLLQDMFGVPDTLYRRSGKNIFRNPELFELLSEYGLDIKRTFCCRHALSYCAPYLETCEKSWYLPENQMKILLEHSPLNTPDDAGRFPLCFYVSTTRSGNDTKVCDDLIAAGADVKVKTSGNATLLHFCRNVKLAKKLLSLGVDPNAADNRGVTPILSRVTDYSMMLQLLECGADINAVDKRGRGVYHYWATYSVPELEMALTELNLINSYAPDINAQDTDGNTPLHLFAEKCALAIREHFDFQHTIERNAGHAVRWFLRHGARMNIRNNNGETPIQYYKRLKSEIGTVK